VSRWLDSLELTTDVVVLDLAAEVGNSRVGGIIGTEDLLSLLDLVRLINIVDYRVNELSSP
jgi:hypothetical protein